MLIRPVQPEDRNPIYQILTTGSTFSAGEIRVAIELVDDILKNPAHPDYHVYSALQPIGELTGFICYGPIPLTDYCYDLYWIAVDGRFGQNGIGSLLMDHMEARVLREKGKHIYVDTSSTPVYAAARSFYEKHGYQQICLFENYFHFGDHKIVFKKEL